MNAYMSYFHDLKQRKSNLLDLWIRILQVCSAEIKWGFISLIPSSLTHFIYLFCTFNSFPIFSSVHPNIIPLTNSFFPLSVSYLYHLPSKTDQRKRNEKISCATCYLKAFCEVCSHVNTVQASM